jgi:hypothetical protein
MLGRGAVEGGYRATSESRPGAAGCEGDHATEGEGPPPDFGCWAAQKQGWREKKVFPIFETKDSNKIQMQV